MDGLSQSGRFLLLPVDARELDRMIREASGSIRADVHEASHSVKGSSETWHDNIERDYALHEARVKGVQLSDLHHVRSRAEVCRPSKQTEVVEIGNRVAVYFGDEEDDEKEVYLLAGHHKYGSDERISITSPLGKALKGMRQGESKEYTVEGDRRIKVTVTSIMVAEGED